MRAKLVAIKYGKCHYKTIQPKLEEIAGTFDIERIDPKMEYSLHTEYSFEGSEFNNPIFDKLNVLKKASYNCIPLLWYNDEWCKQFFQFIAGLVGENRPPKIIEVHPPFKDYCVDASTFLKRYSIFEKLVMRKWPESIIAIENRTGSRYRRSEFLVHNASDIQELLKKIEESKYRLKLVLDIPQLFTVFRRIGKLNLDNLRDAFQKFKENKRLIVGIHIWGRNGRAHAGKLDGLFNSDINFKEKFLGFISEYFNDGIPRYLVPEVISTQTNFDSIIDDLTKHFELVSS